MNKILLFVVIACVAVAVSANDWVITTKYYDSKCSEASQYLYITSNNGNCFDYPCSKAVDGNYQKIVCSNSSEMPPYPDNYAMSVYYTGDGCTDNTQIYAYIARQTKMCTGEPGPSVLTCNGTTIDTYFYSDSQCSDSDPSLVSYPPACREYNDHKQFSVYDFCNVQQ